MPERNFKVWEAARATTAYPGYFESFPHSTQQIFEANADTHMNPLPIMLQEAEKVWFPFGQEKFDLVLSIGTHWSQLPPDADLRDHYCTRLSLDSHSNSTNIDSFAALDFRYDAEVVNNYITRDPTILHALASRMISTSFYFESSRQRYKDNSGQCKIQGMPTSKHMLHMTCHI